MRYKMKQGISTQRTNGQSDQKLKEIIETQHIQWGHNEVA